jgi:hypothetical protein
MPSDLARTEYIEFDIEFDKKFTDFLENIIERAEYFEEIAKNTENNPLLAIDYLKRAYLQKMIQKMGGMQGAEGGLPDLSKIKLPPMGGSNKFPF